MNAIGVTAIFTLAAWFDQRSAVPCDHPGKETAVASALRSRLRWIAEVIDIIEESSERALL